MAVVAPELASAPPSAPWGTLLSDLIRQRSVSFGQRDRTWRTPRRDRGLSFRDLERAVDRWAVRLEGAGVAPGATVALVIGDPLDFSVAYLGTIASGRWAAPLDPASPRRGPGGLGAAIARVRPGIVIADAPDPGGLDVDWASLGDDSSFERGTVTEPGATVPVKGTSGGVILASSGTTGAPKVIPLHQHQLLWAARNVARHHELTAGGPGLQPAPPLPRQRRGGRAARLAGGRILARPRRPVPPHGVLALHGGPPHHLDQRRAGHHLPAGRAPSRRGHPSRASASSARPRPRCRRPPPPGSRRPPGSGCSRPTA